MKLNILFPFLILSVVGANGCDVDNPGWVADGYCDSIQYNNPDCDWDGGDCCEKTCVDGPVYSCGSNGYNCRDPGNGGTGQPASCKVSWLDREVEVVLREREKIVGLEERFYHNGYCKVAFPNNGRLEVSIPGSQGIWFLEFEPNNNSFCSNGGRIVKYELQRDGNFVVRCGNEIDYSTRTNQGNSGEYALVIDSSCYLHILKGTIECNENYSSFYIDTELWTSHRSAPLGVGDRLGQGEIARFEANGVLHLQSSDCNLVFFEEMSHGTKNILWAANNEWSPPPKATIHGCYAKVTSNGHLQLVGIDYSNSPVLFETIYFDKDLDPADEACFTVVFDPDTNDLAAQSCHTSADLELFAKYDWKNGAKDVSSVQPPYDGALENTVTARNGILTVSDDRGVQLGYMEELDGAKRVLFRFEDVTLDNESGYSVFLGGGYDQWWVGIYRDIAEWTPEESRETHLVFNYGGWGSGVFELKAPVADKYASSFESIEYRFDGTSPPRKRFAIRYNDGEWFYGGSASPNYFSSFPVSDSSKSEYVKINDGARADWDHWDGTLGTTSLYAAK